MTTIQLRDVSYHYRGRAQPALKGITFNVGAGVTGVVGPNGAGKSTLLRLLAGVCLPTNGSVLVNAASAAAFRAAGRIGLIPETPRFDGYLQVGEFITGLHQLLRDPASQADQLRDIWTQRLDSLSLGQKRKVELAAAMLGDPDLLLLDEPTNGLDPFAIAQLRQTIAGLCDGKRAIFVSSHHLDELQRTADRLLVIAGGRCYGCWEREAAIREFGSVEGLFNTIIGELSESDRVC